MATRFIETEDERRMFIRFVEAHALPFAASTSKGGKRSLKQNRLQRLWMNEIADQKDDMTAEEARGYCKLAIGVPILCAEHEEFCRRYDAIVKPLPYEKKILLMMEPLDFPVTRLMTTRQHAKYLDGVWKHFTEQGFVLTSPSTFGLSLADPNSSGSPSSRPDEGSATGKASGAAPISTSSQEAAEAAGGVMGLSAPPAAILRRSA